MCMGIQAPCVKIRPSVAAILYCPKVSEDNRLGIEDCVWGERASVWHLSCAEKKQNVSLAMAKYMHRM